MKLLSTSAGDHEKRLHKGSRFKESNKVARDSAKPRYLWLRVINAMVGAQSLQAHDRQCAGR